MSDEVEGEESDIDDEEESVSGDYEGDNEEHAGGAFAALGRCVIS